MSNRKSRISSAFTLVELIVVIVILAILATIAFLSFTDQSSSARDSARLSDISNIRKGLEIRQSASGNYPLPANPTKSLGGASATGISSLAINQGNIDSSILPSLSSGIKDPSGSEYRYSTISQGASLPLYYQLAYELENPTSHVRKLNPFGDPVIAFGESDIPSVVKLKGNYSFNPILPSLFILTGSTDSASGGIYNPDLCFAIDGSTTNSFSNIEECLPKNQMRLNMIDPNLIGYWDMETMTGSKLVDLSGNGYDSTGGIITGTGNYTGIIGGHPGVIGKSTYFSGNLLAITATGTRLMMDYPTHDITMIAIMKDKGVIDDGIGCEFGPSGQLPIVGNYRYNIRGVEGEFVASVSNGWVGANILKKDYAYNEKWKMISFKKNGTQISLFMNGSLIGTADRDGSVNTGGYGYTYIQTLLIGATQHCAGPGNKTYAIGAIDDIKIYDRALTDQEIIQQAKVAGF